MRPRVHKLISPDEHEGPGSEVLHSYRALLVKPLLASLPGTSLFVYDLGHFLRSPAELPSSVFKQCGGVTDPPPIKCIEGTELDFNRKDYFMSVEQVSR